MTQKKLQLGIDPGTAAHRLRMNILFQLAGECNKLSCYRCNELIQTVDDFSIDHKKPWLYNNPDLFWDLNNIAFSHRSCNYSNKRNNTDRTTQKEKVRRNKGPEGTAWCGCCKQYLDEDKFSSNKNRWNNLQSECIACRKLVRNR